MEYSIGEMTYSYKVDGEGPCIVLLHGFTGSQSTWSAFVEKWQSSFRMITVDLPGHGKTIGQASRTMKEVCDDLACLFTHLEIGPFHLVGYSLGGRTALSFALLYPAYVTSLILESASPGLKTDQERAERIESDRRLAQRIQENGLAKFVDFWEDLPLFASQRKLAHTIRAAIREERMHQSVEGLVQSLLTMGTGCQPSWWDQLKELKTPVLLIVGEWDAKFVEINQQMKRKLETAELAVIKQAGHAVHLEQFSLFANRITEFVLRIDEK